MAEILRVIQPVPHKKLVRGIKSNELRLVLELRGNMFVQQGANVERARRSLAEQRHETVKGSAGVDNVLDEKDVLPFKPYRADSTPWSC